MHCSCVLTVFAVAASPYFILNTFEFGHPLKTGYDFWVPWLAEKQAAFSLHNVPPQLAMIWSEITAVGISFAWPTFSARALMRADFRFSLCSRSGIHPGAAIRDQCTSGGKVYFVAIVTFRFVEGRFYLPILFLLVALAVLPAEWAVGPSV